MSLEEIKTKVAEMQQSQQDHLAAYLVHLRHMRDPKTQEEITSRMNDRNPAQWISPSELREKWKD